MKLKHRLTGLPFLRQDNLMDTVVWQKVYGINSKDIAEIIIQEIRRFEKKWSLNIPDNPINRLNQFSGNLQPIEIGFDTVKILTLAKDFYYLFHKTFDVTINPLVKIWKNAARQGCLPDKIEIERLLHLVNSDDIAINSEIQAYLSKPGQSIDLGGIAKGYVADRAKELYQNMGIRHALINLGGNILVLGKKPDNTKWKIAIQDPLGLRGHCIGFIEVKDCSVVTSGGYERFFEYNNHRYCHILNPKTGIPAISDIASVTIISKSSVLADALSTAVFILGLESGIKLIEKMVDTHAIIIDLEGKIYQTQGILLHKFPLFSKNRF